MKITKTVENEDGSIEMEANLAADEVAFIVEVGMNFILAKGAQPFVKKEIEVTHKEPEHMQ